MQLDEMRTLKIVHSAMTRLDESGVDERVTQAMSIVSLAMQYLQEKKSFTADILFEKAMEICGLSAWDSTDKA